MTQVAHNRATAEQVVLDGWRINNITLGEALNNIQALAQADTPSLVVTPNVQHLRTLRSDDDFRASYAQAKMVLADGMPLVWASVLGGTPLKERVCGADVERGLCARLERIGGHVIYIGGNTQEINDQAVRNRQAQFPGLRVDGRSPSMQFANSPSESADLISYVNELTEPERPTAIFVCAGAPKSEKWAAENLHRFERGVILPVGAAIDFAGGVKQRANERMQRGGFEWLHRMLSEPARLGPRYAKDSFYLGGLMVRTLVKRIAGNANQQAS